MKTTKVTIEKKSLVHEFRANGAIVISAIIKSVKKERVYFGFTLKEAKGLFLIQNNAILC